MNSLENFLSSPDITDDVVSLPWKRRKEEKVESKIYTESGKSHL